MNNYLNNITYQKDYLELEKQYTINNDPNFKLLSESYISTDNVIINIDSRNRNKISKNIIDESFTLIKNPIIFNSNSNIVNIFIENHNLQINDLITIDNVGFDLVNLDQNDVIFTNNCEYVKINYDISNQNKDNIIMDNNIISKYENQFIDIIYLDKQSNFIGNIPIDILKSKFQIYFNILNTDTNELNLNKYTNKYFYIKLPIKFINYSNTTEQFNLKFKLLNIAGININNINSNFPLSINYKEGFKKIINKTKDTISINVNNNASYTINKNNRGSGGNNIIINKIKKIIKGYPNSNNYKIEIPNLNNIKSMIILSSDIPHTDYNIKSSINNKLYITFLHKNLLKNIIEIDEGYYDLSLLIDNIKKKINLINFNVDQNTIPNENKNHFNLFLSSNIEYNNSNDKILINIYNNIKIPNSLSIVDSTELIFMNKNEIENFVLIKVNHTNHYLKKFNKIIISNSNNICNIDKSLINKDHEIFHVLDENNYLIKLNFSSSTITDNNSNGGDNITIKYPILFSLDFSKKDTLGRELGFRNPGSVNSITSFDYNISNYTPYKHEYNLKNTISNNKINLNDINYILLSCNLFNNINDNKNIFIKNNKKYTTIAKIYLNNLNKIVYNNHVNLLNKFDYIIQNVNEIEFIFHDCYGNLYDFKNIDHSFLIRFDIEKIEDKYTNINTNTGLSSVNTSTQKVSVVPNE